MLCVSPDRRALLDAGGVPQRAGDLAYQVVRAADRFLSREGAPCFEDYAAAIAALEAAKLVLYRRHLGGDADDLVAQINALLTD